VHVAVPPHGGRLVRAQSPVRARLRGADEGEAAPLVLVVVAARVAVVELTVEHAHGTGQVPALLAQAGQGETRAAGGTCSSSRAVTV
jgi:hypothetical protein